MVTAIVAYVNIQGDGGQFRPGVHTQMRLGQQNRSRYAAGGLIGVDKSVCQLIHWLKRGAGHSLQTPLQQPVSVRQPVAVTLALGEIGGKVQTLHGVDFIPFQPPHRVLAKGPNAIGKIRVCLRSPQFPSPPNF